MGERPTTGGDRCHSESLFARQDGVDARGGPSENGPSVQSSAGPQFVQLRVQRRKPLLPPPIDRLRPTVLKRREVGVNVVRRMGGGLKRRRVCNGLPRRN